MTNAERCTQLRLQATCFAAAALIFLLWYEIQTVDGYAVALGVAIGGFPRLRRAIHRRVNARHTARRAQIRADLDTAAAVAARTGLWWPEADGSISVGGHPLTRPPKARA